MQLVGSDNVYISIYHVSSMPIRPAYVSAARTYREIRTHAPGDACIACVHTRYTPATYRYAPATYRYPAATPKPPRHSPNTVNIR